jgi:hypothetical protein
MPPIQPRPAGFDPAPFLARIARGDAACGRIDMRIDRDGNWYHEGAPIRRPALVRLFAGILHRLPDGSHWLVTPAEQLRIEVEDAAFVAVELRSAGEGRGRVLEFRTNLGEWLRAGPEHPLRLRPAGTPPVPVPCLLAKNGLEARLARSVYYELVELALSEADAEDGALALWSDGVRFPIGQGGD